MRPHTRSPPDLLRENSDQTVPSTDLDMAEMLRPPSRAASQVSRQTVESRRNMPMYGSASAISIRSTVARSHAGFTAPQEQWRPPVLSAACCTTVSRASHYTALYSILQSLFTVITGVFDMYTLAEAEPGKDHFGYYIISFEFVYAGNPHVRWCLMVLALGSTILGVMLLVTSVLLLKALQEEYEPRIRPWLLAMLFHTVWRFFAFIFAAFVNDMYFSYHGLMCAAWAAMVPLNVYCWLIVWSMFNELTEVSRLEDIACMKMGGTLNSLPTSMLSGGNSRRFSRRPSLYSTTTDHHRPSVSVYTDQPRPSVASCYQDEPM
ncbi:uncharacterized protein LOC122364215 [Amphibalanus amphitrite]|uniref:uncharacterized protein LOC122364215 n=1 Tax=Amphibalanus amphitrite TaxID=1232801 RepID=UPI001C91FB56|nr:uncharacterized protein LOC122364215 [Amphibalanus amphitrite]XP_043190341.1 uncharacterized protein LOC122364215 [Amphibalanus amphitrite]XP_043190349.1 uncharacterized protein LOC122364215 [Amphibalanus amphitrite]